MNLPRVAIVGRPNVGKSSLLNRLAGRRVSIVEPTAGVTRDRVTAVLEMQGRKVEFIDTGGLGLVDEELLKKHIEAQIQVALASTDLVLFVVDGKEGRVPGDEMVAADLRRIGKPIVLVVNKLESAWEEIGVHDWLAFGFGDPMPVSAKEGFGIHELKAKLTEFLPEHVATSDDDAPADMMQFAIVGKRNSGKSTLTNLLAGEERVIVSEIPGTTRDAVDVTFEFGDRTLRAIDTAGVRKKKSIQDAIEFFSHARSTESIRRADVVVHMFDVTEEVSQVDKKLAAYAVEHHKPILLVGNKIDLAGADFDIEKWSKYLGQQLPGLMFAPVTFVSATENKNVKETIELLFELRDQSRTRMPTAKLNEALQTAKEKLSPRSRSIVPKLFYGTQIGTEPLSILMFVNEPKLFHGQWERYLSGVLRKTFDVPEVPIRMIFRKREKVTLTPK